MCYFCTSKNDGIIAQLVERRTENPCVPGSSPGDATPKALAKGLFSFIDLKLQANFEKWLRLN